MNPQIIELIEDTATTLGISKAKAQAVYVRGVQECLNQGYEEEPYIHGMMRLHRFVESVTSSSDRLTEDTDLLPKVANTIEKSDSVVLDLNQFKMIEQFNHLSINQNIDSVVIDLDTEELILSCDGQQQSIKL